MILFRFSIRVILTFGIIITAIPTILSSQMTWTCLTPAAPWSVRFGQTMLVFHDTMWLFGGNSSRRMLNDVWYSTNGVSWICVTDSAQWPARTSPRAVVFDNKIWLTGGLYWENPNWVAMHDIWYSANGIDWTQVTDSPPWAPRGIHSLTVFHDTMWLVGGWDGGIVMYNDVWKSVDGDSWICVTDSAPWLPRLGHSMIIFRDTMLMFGGYVYNDVWHSGDGVDWTCVQSAAPWHARYGQTSLVLRDTIWMMSGYYYNNGTFFHDVWYSADGSSWLEAVAAAPWRARCYSTSLVRDDRILFMAGTPDYYLGLNDIWYTPGLGVEESPMPNAKYVTPKATIVRNVMMLAPNTSDKSQGTRQLLDISGREVMDLHAGANNIRYLAPGVYFIRRNNNNQVTKIIVTK